MLGRIARWIDLTLKPEAYHGADRQPPYFEGWYFKFVTPDTADRYAIIPGIFLSHDPERHHAFVQVFDGMAGRATYHRYPAEAFSAVPGALDIRIGPNRFTRRSVELDIDDGLRTVRGRIELGCGMGWPVSVRSPGIMGPFAWLPFMECYHGIVSFDHAVHGALSDDGRHIDFSGGRGYLEKDWGQSFPAGHIWMQTNHFDAAPGTSLMASIAVIPMLGSWFPGFICGLHHDGRLYAFTTHGGARIERLDVDDHQVCWAIASRTERLTIRAERADHALLPGPNRADMSKRVPETLKATIHIRLTDRADGRTIVDSTGRCAGLEVAGDYERVLAAIRRANRLDDGGAS